MPPVMGVAGEATSEPVMIQEEMSEPLAFHVLPSQAMICPLEVR